MSHVDEGQLHAYLDRQLGYADSGNREELEAHVAECSACATLLDRARTEHTRTGELLLQGEPVLGDPPPFEAVAARARTQASRRAGTLARTRTLAWAASIVLAVAVGWYARFSLGEGGFDESNLDRVSPAAQTAAGERPTEPALPMNAPLPRAVSVASEIDPVSDPPPVTIPESVVSGDLRRMREERPQAVEAQLRVAQELLRDRMTDRDAAQTRQDRVVRANDEIAPAFALREEPDSVAAHVEVRIRDLFATAIDVWREVDRDTAEGVLGQPIMAVDGLPIAGIAISASAVPVVRVIQLLPSGDSLEIIQRPAALSELQAAETAARGVGAARSAGVEGDRTTTSSRSVGGLLITGRAAIAADSLAALLAVLREAPRSN